MPSSNKIKMLYIKKANLEDIEEEYNFTQKLPFLENGFKNFFYDIPKEEFREKCIEYEICLSLLTSPFGMVLPMTTYYLWLDKTIIGIFTVIHELNEYQKERDGHIAYAILKEYRGNGYATKGLSMVLEDAKNYVKEDEIYMHTQKNNKASLKVMINNGARIVKETETDCFTRIKIR